MSCGRRPALYASCLAVLLLCTVASFAQSGASKSGPQSEHDQQIDRELWFRTGRTLKDSAEPAAAALQRAQQYKAAQRAARVAFAAASGSQTVAASDTTSSTPLWRSLGPAPMWSDATGVQDYGLVTGRSTAVAVDPNDPTGNTVYVGAAYGGVWKSTNAANPDPTAVIWTPLTEDAPTLATGAIAVQPGNANVVLVGTGEPNNAIDSYYGLGILRSSDGGSTWTTIDTASGGQSFKGQGFSRFAFNTDTGRQNIVVAAMAGTGKYLTTSLCNNCRGVYYSSDSGVTWTMAAMTDSGVTTDAGSVQSVVYNPALHRFFAVVKYHGFYISTDDSGSAFVKLANQPNSSLITSSACPATPVSYNCPMYRGDLAMRPGASEMYAWFVQAASATSGTMSDRGIWRTMDGGQSWTALEMSGVDSCGDSAGCGAQQAFFNLTLAAVPNGDATDLYAGAVNLFKCTVTAANPTCSSAWMNLTHVYGCYPYASPSHVHPDQHGIDFPRGPNAAPMVFFSNDGGVYRTLDTNTLNTGLCSGHNAFDNLNANMGSLSQFVWFSQHPTDAGTLLGGLQDNGSPAVTAASSGANGTTWTAFMPGDGGWNAINPDNPNEWFTSYVYVSIGRCGQGTNCQGLFQTVVSSSTVGGDDGAFYTPYMLDPQATSQLIVGTCRVWRGPAVGGSYTALSYNFGTGSGSICDSSSADMIRSLAASGPVTANGSQVVYAGTETGKLWVTTNADAGPGSWVDRSSGLTNSGRYPISSIAVDTADLTGLTAWVTVMGFHTSHVFRTADGGATWWDATGNLPDAPADAVAIDPNDHHIVYVANDVGVFINTDGTNLWTEYGPAGGAGALPNAAVTRLDAFNSGGVRKLRASTYGRGVWETDLAGTPATGDFSLQAATDSGLPLLSPGTDFSWPVTVIANNGYSGTLRVSCSVAPASRTTCSYSAQTFLAPGVLYLSLHAGDAGAYTVTVNATDGTRAHSTSFVVSVQDFSLAATQASISGDPGQAITANVNVQTLSWNGATLNLSCDAWGSQSGSSCSIDPASVTSSGTATLTINTGHSGGAWSVSVTGTAASLQHKISIPVNVAGDFALSVDKNSVTLTHGQTANFVFTITPKPDFGSGITLTCSSGLPEKSNCSFSPSVIFAGTSTVSSTLSLSTSAGGTNVQASARPRHAAPWALWLALPGIAMAGSGVRARKRRWLLMLGLVIIAASLLTACGGGGSGGSSYTPPPPTIGGTPAGTYTVTVTAASGSFTHSTNVTVVVQ